MPLKIGRLLICGGNLTDIHGPVQLNAMPSQWLILPKLTTVVPTKSDNNVILCLQLLSKTLTCTLHFS